MDRVSSCNVYVVQIDTQCSFMVDFIHNICQLYNVSDLTGPSSGASFKAVRADWYVVIHVLLGAPSRYGVVGGTYIVNKINHKRTLCIITS
jgi:hypothetical protein